MLVSLSIREYLLFCRDTVVSAGEHTRVLFGPSTHFWGFVECSFLFYLFIIHTAWILKALAGIEWK